MPDSKRSQNQFGHVSVIIPAKNEAASLASLLPRLRSTLPGAEILVVDDGSTDQTAGICDTAGVTRIRHAYSKGNGAAIKSGARAAKGDILVFMDGDGQHDPRQVPKLLDALLEGHDMVVGSRRRSAQASRARWVANSFYNAFAGWMVGRNVEDLTSGFRAAHAVRFREFLHLLPNGFSYPTTITMAFFRAGYSICYEPVDVAQRQGKSHIRLLRDGLRFLLIIFRVGTLYSPLKLFFPMSVAVFMVGLAYYGYTFISFGRFTNMSATLFISSMQIFLMGLISEQITALQYQRKD